MKRNKLDELLNNKRKLRAIECNSGLSALIIEKTKIKKNQEEKEYDALWISSLCDSLLRGKPDIEVVELKDRINSLEWIIEVSNKPLIVDLDSGGSIEHWKYSLRTLYKLGISAVVIEDKTGKKVNSLFQNRKLQEQDTISNFCEKIQLGKRITKNEMWIIARIESLVLGKEPEEALYRATKYIEAGADAILIHHNKKDISRLKKFCESYLKIKNRVPLIFIPTTYSYMYENELYDMGADIIIYANQLTRSSIAAMEVTASKILDNGRAWEASKNCISINDVISYVEEIESDYSRENV